MGVLRDYCKGTRFWRHQHHILTISNQLFRLPPQIRSPEHVTVIDARNRAIRFFLDTICSAEVCEDYIFSLNLSQDC